MKQAFLLISCLAVCAFSATAQNKAAGSNAMSDQKFVDFVAQTDMVEANLGDLAQNVAASEDVKGYGKMLVADHTSNYQNLQSLAQQNGFTVPTAIDGKNDKTMIDPFHALKGAAFDKKYIHDMVAGHTQAIAIVKKEAEGADNPALKAFAQDMLPALQKHLDHAKEIEQGKKPAM